MCGYEVITLICACDHCYYLFEAPELPEQCPDCGKQATRPANEQEDVYKRQIWQSGQNST